MARFREELWGGWPTSGRDSLLRMDPTLSVSWYSHYGNQYGDSQKTNSNRIELSYDPVIPFLGIYPDKNIIQDQKDTWIPIFIVALFIISKTWKQSKWLSTDE